MIRESLFVGFLLLNGLGKSYGAETAVVGGPGWFISPTNNESLFVIISACLKYASSWINEIINLQGCNDIVRH